MEMGKLKNKIIMVNYYLKEKKEMGKEKYMMIMMVN